MNQLEPKKISPDGSKMKIEWNDGSVQFISYLDLREKCPCAVCVDEMTGRQVLIRTDLSPDVKPLGVEGIGNYAISVRWSDGHSTGIYHFDRLRAFGNS